jgi:broad specificity phosphatase PhoE
MKGIEVLRVFLVRHGETVWNREGRVQGHTDVPLSAAGVEQARRMARRFAEEKIDAVWSSDLMRARATGGEVAESRGLAVVTTPLLRETMLGEWEGLTEPEIVARGEGDLFQQWRRQPDLHRPPNSEPLEMVWARMIRALGQIRAEIREGTVVISGHGGSLRAILCDAIGAPLSSLNRFALENTSVSLIEYTEHRTWVRFVNDTCHLREP